MKLILHMFCAVSLMLSAEIFADNDTKSVSSAEAKSSVNNPTAEKTEITNESEYAEFVKKRAGVASSSSAKSSQSKSTSSNSVSLESIKSSVK